MIGPGSRLAHYDIMSAIGKGGMGEVWRARDTRLGRDVAIKTLPAPFVDDADRLARFEREARLLASLNHPNIAAIHGFEQDAGTHFIVLELVEGETLEDRLRRGRPAPGEALTLALQIAEALEAAHEHGVIHRDLKPANIKITPEGRVKVLDFGLAKALAGDGANAHVSNSPTLSIAATRQGGSHRTAHRSRSPGRSRRPAAWTSPSSICPAARPRGSPRIPPTTGLRSGHRMDSAWRSCRSVLARRECT